MPSQLIEIDAPAVSQDAMQTTVFSTASAPQTKPPPAGPRINFQDLPNEIRDMVWSYILWNNTVLYQEVPSVIEHIPSENSSFFYNIQEDGKQVPMKAVVAGLISVECHPIMHICKVTRAFAMKEAENGKLSPGPSLGES
jgi:hypothetical protein